MQAWHLFCFLFDMLSKPGKIVRIAGAMLLLFILGCNHTDHAIEPVEKVTKYNPKNASAPVTDTIYAGDRDTTILIKVDEAFIIGHIIANKAQPEYTLSARKGQTVTAILKPSKKGGNVRINQIQQPGGAFDGPFGDSLSYTFKRSGNIRFIIGENLMAGDPYTGDFILHIKLSEL
jgi:hypothetical protein